MCVIAKGIPRGCQGLFTPVSLGYPLSVFNKNSTLKPKTKNKNKRKKERTLHSFIQESSLLRVSRCERCSLSCLFEHMCTRLPFISWSIAVVPSSQALPGYLISAPPSVCVPDVIGALSVWIQQPNKSMVHCGSAFEPGASGLPYYCTSICVRS